VTQGAIRRPALSSRELVGVAGSVVVCGVAFLAFPVSLGVTSSYVAAGVFRGVWAGLAGGLLLPNRSWRAAAGAAALGALLGGCAANLGLDALAAWEVALAALLAAGVASGVSWMCRRGWQRVAVGLAILCIVVGLAWQIGLVAGPFSGAQREFLRTTATEPATEGYHFDGQIYLKTMFLMKRGTPYFVAFSQAVKEDTRYLEPPPLVFNYREAWPARFVTLLPGNPGIAAWATFFALVLIGILGAYLLASQFLAPGAALLGPMLLVSYFAFPLTTKWFPLVEFWAGALAVLAIALFARERWWAAAVAVTIAVATRELMVYLIPVGLFAWLAYPKRRAVVLPVAAMVLLPCVVLGYHALSSPGTLGAGGQSVGVASWLHGSFWSLLAALRFSSNHLVWGKLVAMAVPLVAVVGAAQVPLLWRKVLLASVVVVPAVALALFSTGVFGYYWGAIMQPVALAIAPLALVFALPRAESAKRAGSSGGLAGT